MEVDGARVPQAAPMDTPIRVQVLRDSLPTPMSTPHVETTSTSSNHEPTFLPNVPNVPVEPWQAWVMQHMQVLMAPMWEAILTLDTILEHTEAELAETKEALEGMQSWFMGGGSR